MNTTKTNQQLIQFKAKKESFELNIDDNDLGDDGEVFEGGCLTYNFNNNVKNEI